MDRRSAKRFHLRLRCFVTTLGPQPLHFEGRTENISRSGVLICPLDPSQCQGRLNPGDDIDVDLELPPNTHLKTTRSLHCRATLVGLRTGASNEPYLAASIHQMEFRDLPGQFLAELLESTNLLVM
jgi:hypothetical protein